MNFTFDELENLLNRIDDVITYFEEVNIQSKDYKLYLTNGEYINFKTQRNCLAHLIGVNCDYLQSTGLFKGTSSFELLKELKDSKHRIYDYATRGILNYNMIFSKHIYSKLEKIKENIRINVNDTDVVCKYNKEKAYNLGLQGEKCDYVVIRTYEDGKIGVLTLVERDYYYVPMSNRLYNSFDQFANECKGLIENQELTLLNGFNIYDEITDYNKKIYLDYETKIKKIDTLKNYALKFNTSIDVTNDYEYYVKNAQKHKTLKDGDLESIKRIADSISKGKVINSEFYNNNSLIEIVNAFNNYIINKSGVLEDVSRTYSSLIEELRTIKETIIELNAKNESLISENEALRIQNETLNAENETLTATQNEILNILKKGNIKGKN